REGRAREHDSRLRSRGSGGRLPHPRGDCAARTGARGHAHSRGRDAAGGRHRAARGPVRARRLVARNGQPSHDSGKVRPMEALTVGQAAERTGWSARMLRYLETAELVVPARTPSGYRLYRLRELNQLRSLRELRQRFGLELSDMAFAARLRREPALRAAVESWLAGIDLAALEWEQRTHEALLAA